MPPAAASAMHIALAEGVEAAAPAPLLAGPPPHAASTSAQHQLLQNHRLLLLHQQHQLPQKRLQEVGDCHPQSSAHFLRNQGAGQGVVLGRGAPYGAQSPRLGGADARRSGHGGTTGGPGGAHTPHANKRRRGSSESDEDMGEGGGAHVLTRGAAGAAAGAGGAQGRSRRPPPVPAAALAPAPTPPPAQEPAPAVALSFHRGHSVVGDGAEVEPGSYGGLALGPGAAELDQEASMGRPASSTRAQLHVAPLTEMGEVQAPLPLPAQEDDASNVGGSNMRTRRALRSPSNVGGGRGNRHAAQPAAQQAQHAREPRRTLSTEGGAVASADTPPPAPGPQAAVGPHAPQPPPLNEALSLGPAPAALAIPASSRDSGSGSEEVGPLAPAPDVPAGAASLGADAPPAPHPHYHGGAAGSQVQQAGGAQGGVARPSVSATASDASWGLWGNSLQQLQEWARNPAARQH